MLKNNKNMFAKPSNALIIIGVLKGYIKNPVMFFLSSVISFKKYRRRLNSNLPKDFLNSSGLIAWLYIRLKEKVRKEEAYEIIRTAVLCSGLAVQQSNFRNVEDKRTFENLIKNQKNAKENGSTKLNEMKIIEESDNRYIFKVTKCMFYDFFSSQGVPELTKIMCSIDNAIFSSYLPERIIFHRNGVGNRISDGSKECLFFVEKVVENK